jgi:alpha-soluble NSF attachment protein
MAHLSDQANELVAKADKKLKSFSLFGNKTEDALELLQKACTLYKQAKDYDHAGETFRRVAELHLKVKSNYEAASAFIEAATAFKKTSTANSAACYEEAIKLYLDLGRFSQAAKYHKEAAELYEADNNMEMAMQHYNQAADFYSGEEQTSSANQCLLKVAQMNAELEQYQKAIEIYEQVASASLDVALLRWSVKDYLFHAGLCHLAFSDASAARAAVDKYQEMDPNFADSRECTLLTACVQAIDDGDPDAFTQAVADYDSVSKLDRWRTSVLLKVKRQIQDGDDLT